MQRSARGKPPGCPIRFALRYRVDLWSSCQVMDFRLGRVRNEVVLIMRRVLNIIGWILLALGVVILCYDLVKWMLSGDFLLIDAGLLWNSLHPTSLQVAEPAIARYIHPFLWYPVITTILLTPAFVVFGLPGLVLLAVTRNRDRAEQSDLFMG